MYRHSAQSCCPFNVKFAQELKEPAFAPRAVIAGKDARTLAADLLAMEQAEFSAAFRKSPMKRAKLAGLQRNARVVSREAGRQCVRSGVQTSPAPWIHLLGDGRRTHSCASFPHHPDFPARSASHTSGV